MLICVSVYPKNREYFAHMLTKAAYRTRICIVKCLRSQSFKIIAYLFLNSLVNYLKVCQIEMFLLSGSNKFHFFGACKAFHRARLLVVE